MDNSDMYYYFITNTNPHRITKTNERVDTNIMWAYLEFTQEQIDFYLEHPEASVYEIKRCELYPPYVPPVPTIEELREKAIKELDNYSRETLGKKVDVLGFCDAISSTIYAKSRGYDSIYTSDETLKTADDFLYIGKACRDNLKNSIESINSAETAEEIQTIMLTSKEFFDRIIAEQDTIETHRIAKLREIDVYDTCEMVNGFFYNGTLMWLDKDTRTSLVNTLNSALLVGRETVNIWFSGLYITLEIEEARQMLAALEVYATDCYNVTATHKAQVMRLETIEDIDAFDVTADYPVRLEFTTNIQNK